LTKKFFILNFSHQGLSFDITFDKKNFFDPNTDSARAFSILKEPTVRVHMAVRAQAGATRGEASRGAPLFRLRLRLRLDFKCELGPGGPQLLLKVKLKTKPKPTRRRAPRASELLVSVGPCEQPMGARKMQTKNFYKA
jgi:hypothetical protein